MRRKYMILLIATMGFACHRSGTWVDDPRNVRRAWGTDFPPSIVVRHSWYWRSPHFTREEAYYFQFAWNEKLYSGFIEENRMKPLGAAHMNEYLCFDRPKWFAPGDPAEYEIWAGPESNNGILLRQRKSNELFIGDCQL